MATKRKRNRGLSCGRLSGGRLSGLPAEHAKEAKKLAQASKRHLEAIERHGQDGDCAFALHELVGAMTALRGEVQELTYAGDTAGAREAADFESERQNHALALFKRHCVVKRRSRSGR